MIQRGATEEGTAFGEILREQRRAAGLTQEQLAERAGLSTRSISELERGGSHVPRRDTVALLVRALGLVGEARESLEGSIDRRRGPRAEREPDSLAELPASALPRDHTRFVGREQQLAELASALAGSAVLTLIGPGGVGKTRLAVQVAATDANRYRDGVRLVELAALADPSLVTVAVAASLGVAGTRSPRALVDALAETLKPRQMLLVLDNCEHLVQACADLVAHLLRECPNLHVLATSREPLAIDGEVVWLVSPLALPDPRHPDPDAPAMQLFLDRARAANATLTVTEDGLRAAAQICVRLDGIPLALELAAARLRALSLEQLAARLQANQALLVGRSRNPLQHHQTLHAALDWSHDLLGEQERVMFARLSVFAGGWSLESAEAVATGDGVPGEAVIELISQLVDRSMIVAQTHGAEARYRMLEPIRQYALEHLERSGETSVWRTRHAAAMLALAERSVVRLGGPLEIESLDSLELEHDNFRTALRCSLTQGDGDTALRLACALWRFWERRGHYAEGCVWIDEALALAVHAPNAIRGNAMNALAMLRWATGDATLAAPLAEQARNLCRAAGDSRGVAWALISLGMIAYYQSDAAPALRRLEESVAYARGGVDVPLLSLALSCLGRARLWINGKHDPLAETALDESLSLARQAQSRHATGQALTALGELAWRRGQVDSAIDRWRQALELRRDLRDRRGVAGSVERLALGAVASEQFERAAWLLGAAESQRRAIGLNLRHDEERDHSQAVAVLRQRLSEAGVSRIWAEGHAASTEDAVRLALGAAASE